MNEINILLVEDEETLAMIIKDTLEGEGFRIRTATNGEEGLLMFFAEKPDVLVADVMMPRMDGFEMVSRIRRRDKQTPVLFLTARSAIGDVVQGFELGANDYLKKPFGMQELIIRIKALLGKASLFTQEEEKEQREFIVGDYRLNCINQQLTYVDGQSMSLSYRESELLRMLCIHLNRVVEMQEILLRLWGDDSFFNQRSLHVFITKLRRKLSKDERIRIVNVRGIGYKLIAE